MELVFLVVFLMFGFYYLASLNSLTGIYKLLFVLFFLLASSYLRYLINPNLNKDYYLYYNFNIFQKPQEILSYFLNEPYLYLVYSFFKLFSQDKEVVFLCIYWFNFSITNLFFVWLVTRNDIQTWKKMLFFGLYYFLFAFILLRNAPVYMLFGCYFYYSFRDKNFDLVLLTPFMHISSLVILITFFHKKKNYFILLISFTLLSLLFLLVAIPALSDLMTFRRILVKTTIYFKGMLIVGFLHYLFFLLISTVVLIATFVYKKKILHPILVTTILLYYVTFLMNPIVAFRYSPYLFLAILFYKQKGYYNELLNKTLNYSSFLMILVFIYSFYDTNNLGFFLK